MLVEPSTGLPSDRIDLLTTRPNPQRAMLTIDPEDGWSEDELNQADAEGWGALTLGSLTLRAHTAPVTAIAVLLYVWGEL